MRLFSYDGPIVGFLTKFLDCILLSVLWLVFSLPVVTIGASSAAMYTTVYKYIRRDQGTLWQTFWTAFKGNLKRATPAWLIALVVQAVLVADAVVLRGMVLRQEPMGGLYWIMLILCCVSVVWVVYLTAYAARFNGTVKDILKFSILLTVVHPLSALELLATVLVSAALVIIGPGSLAILPAAAGVVCSIIMEKVFLKHMSQEDIEKTVNKEDSP